MPVQLLGGFQHSLGAGRRGVGGRERAARGQVRRGAFSSHRAERALAAVELSGFFRRRCVVVKSQVVLQFQLRDGGPVRTVIFALGRSEMFPVGQGKCMILAVVLAIPLIANGRSIGVVPGWRRGQRVFEVEGVCVGLLQHLGSRLGIVGGSSLRRRR